MPLKIDPCHIWNVSYSARSNRSHPPTSRNIAPATKNGSHDWSSLHMKRHLHCAEQQDSTSKVTKYCLPRKMTLQNFRENYRKQVKRHLQCAADPSMIRDRSEHDPRMIRAWAQQSATHHATEVTFRARREQFVWKTATLSRSSYDSKFHQVLRLPQIAAVELLRIVHLPRKVTLNHQIVHMPRKMTFELHHIMHLLRKGTLEHHLRTL